VTLLLDTHVLLWWLAASPKLGPVARRIIGSPDATVWISAATAWEIAIKVSLGRLTLGEAPEVALPRELDRNGFRALPVTVAHALAVRALPAHHADPFDRLLIAQVRLEGLTLVTADPTMRRYGVALVDASR
jgi:PIN domain nuclease of toxin-antitoxin system